jgi:L-lactate dehydrogenase complex protein LldF
LKLWGFFATRPALYRLATRLAIGVLGLVGKKAGRFQRLPLAGGWTVSRDLPAPSGKTFMAAYKKSGARVS